MQCTDCQKLLSRYLDDGLDSAERQAVLEHLHDCPDCRRQLEELEQLTRQIRDFPRIKAPSGFERRVAERLEAPSWPRRLLNRLFLPWQVKIPAELAAAALFCVALLLLVQNEPLKQQALAPSTSLEQETSLEEPLQEVRRPAASQRAQEQKRLMAKSGELQQAAAPEPYQIVALSLVPRSKSRARQLDAVESEHDSQVKAFSSGPSASNPPLLERIRDLARAHEARFLTSDEIGDGSSEPGLSLSIPAEQYAGFIRGLKRFFDFQTPPPQLPAQDRRPVRMHLQLQSPS